MARKTSSITSMFFSLVAMMGSFRRRAAYSAMPGAEQIITPHYDWHACGHGIRLRLMYRPHFSHKKGGNEWTQSAVVLHAIPSSQTPRSPKSQAKQSSPPRPAI